MKRDETDSSGQKNEIEEEMEEGKRQKRVIINSQVDAHTDTHSERKTLNLKTE